MPAPNQNFLSHDAAADGQLLPRGRAEHPVSHLFGVRLDYNVSDVRSVLLPRQRQQVSRGHRRLDLRGARRPATADCTTPIACATPGRTRATGRTRSGATVIDTQLSTNRFYTIDEQRQLVQYKPTDVRPAGLHGSVLPERGRLPPAARQHRRLSGPVAGHQPQWRQDDEPAGTGQRDAGPRQRTRSAAASTSGRRCGSARRAASIRARSTSRATTRRQASDESQLTPSNLGLSLAAFMLGVPTSISIEDQVAANFSNHYHGCVRAGHVAPRSQPDDQRRPALRVRGRHPREGRSDARRLRPDGADVDLAGGRGCVSGQRRAEHARACCRASRCAAASVFATDPGQDGADVEGPGHVDAAGVGRLQTRRAGRSSRAATVSTTTRSTRATRSEPGRLQRHDDHRKQLGSGPHVPREPQHGPGRSVPGSRRRHPVRRRRSGRRSASTPFSATHSRPRISTASTPGSSAGGVGVQRELVRNLGLEIAYNGSYSDRLGRTHPAGLPARAVLERQQRTEHRGQHVPHAAGHQPVPHSELRVPSDEQSDALQPPGRQHVLHAGDHRSATDCCGRSRTSTT